MGKSSMNESIWEENKEKVEAIIDIVGMFSFMCMVGDICDEKADHIRSNWQDENLAKVWDKEAKVIHSATHKISKNYLGEK